MPLKPLMTQIVGSYVKPKWLARHEHMRALDGSWWRVEQDALDVAKRDAVRLAVYEQERAGLDLLTDGEAQRAAYDRHFLAGLTGVDTTLLAREATAWETTGSKRTRDEKLAAYDEAAAMKPRIVGEIRWQRPVAVEELRFLKSLTDRPVKSTVIGPLSLYCQLVDRFYGDEESAVLALADALREELIALEAAGADVLQIDEPMFHMRASLAHRIGKAAITRMTTGVRVPVIVHVCYGYALVVAEKKKSALYPEILEILSDCPITGISLEYEQPRHEPSLLKHCGRKHVILGLLDLSNPAPESVDHITARLTDALRVVPPERLHPSSDCGMWYLDRELAYAKLQSLVRGTAAVCGRIR